MGMRMCRSHHVNSFACHVFGVSRVRLVTCVHRLQVVVLCVPDCIALNRVQWFSMFISSPGCPEGSVRAAVMKLLL